MPIRLVAPDGLVRHAHVVLPPNWPELAPLPVVLAYHGGGADAVGLAGMAGRSRMHEVGFSGAALDQFVTIYPEAWSISRAEGAGGSFSPGFLGEDALLFEPDDVGFARTLLDSLQRRMTRALAERFGRPGVEALARERVHAVGFSNGGMMVYRLAIELPPDWSFASFCVASGAIGGQRHPASPLVVNDPVAAGAPVASVLILHSRDDPVIPYLGGTPDLASTDLPNPLDWRGLDAAAQAVLLGSVEPVSTAEALWKEVLGIGFLPSLRPRDPGVYLPVFDQLRATSGPSGVVAVATGASPYLHEWPTRDLPDTAQMIWHFFRNPTDFG